MASHPDPADGNGPAAPEGLILGGGPQSHQFHALTARAEFQSTAIATAITLND
jgi:hypothetical protein